MIFNDRVHPIECVSMAGSGAIASVTLDADPCVWLGEDNIQIELDTNVILVPSVMRVLGSVNYNGMRTIYARDTNDISIKGKFIAETFAGTETLTPTLAIGVDIRVFQVDLHLSAVGGAVEDYTITKNHKDSGGATYWDTVIHTEAMNALADYIWLPTRPYLVPKDFVLDFAYANTNNRIWGLNIFFQRSV